VHNNHWRSTTFGPVLPLLPLTPLMVSSSSSYA